MSTVSSWNPEAYRRLSLSECHWKLCRQFMTRYQHRFPEEKTVALAHIFANTQLLMEGDADKTMGLVLDLVKDDGPPKNTGTTDTLEQERKIVENGVVKIEIDLESSSTESIIKLESEEDVKPIKREEEVTIVENEPQSKPHKGLTEAPESSIALNEAVPSSLEDLPAEVCLNCSSTGKSRNKHVHKISKLHSEIMTELTHFKPVLDIRKIRDVYRNLVLFDRDFQKTRKEFNALGCGFLAFSGYKKDDQRYSGRVCVRHFILTQSWATTLKKASEKAKSDFFRKMATVCYQIVSKHPSHLPENQIARVEDPATNRKYYKKIIKKFKKDSFKHDLVFSAEFSTPERDELISIATKLGLATESFGPLQQLKIVGHPIPALAIVERVLVHKDPALCELYQVIPPLKDDGRT